MRVVQVSFHTDGQRRDAESLLLAWPTLPAVAACAARAGVDVAVVQAAHRDERVERDGVTYHFVRDDGRRRSRVIDRVAKLSPDVVHAQGFHHGMALRQLTRSLAGIPVLVQDHANAPPGGWRRPAWRWALRSIGGTAFTLREQASPWVDAGLVSSALPIFEVLEGSSDFSPGDRDEARAITGIYGNPCLLWTGRLMPNKDPLMMLDAVERAMQTLPDARLWCCFGQAPMLSSVRTRIRESDTLRSRTALMGSRPRDQMEHLYRAADFYVQTSHAEGSGYSLIEALSCGATPIATDIAPTRRIVGRSGSLTPVGDAPAMSAALVDWAGRDRAGLRQASRARFEEALTFDVIGRQLRDAYASLAGQSTR